MIFFFFHNFSWQLDACGGKKWPALLLIYSYIYNIPLDYIYNRTYYIYFVLPLEYSIAVFCLFLPCYIGKETSITIFSKIHLVLATCINQVVSFFTSPWLWWVQIKRAKLSIKTSVDRKKKKIKIKENASYLASCRWKIDQLAHQPNNRLYTNPIVSYTV